MWIGRMSEIKRNKDILNEGRVVNKNWREARQAWCKSVQEREIRESKRRKEVQTFTKYK